MVDAEHIVRALAALDERDVILYDMQYCSMCRAPSNWVPPYAPDAKLVTDHKPDCPWRLAREWVDEHEGTGDKGSCGTVG